MNADYHHLPKVLDLINALSPESVLEAYSGTPLYAPLIKRFLPSVKRVEETDTETVHALRKRFDLVVCPMGEDGDEHAELDHLRALLERHRGLLVVAPKTDWEKADFAGVAPSLFVNDPSGIIAYLGATGDIKALRKNLLRQRVRRQSGFTPTIEAVYRAARLRRSFGGQARRRK